MHDEEEEDLSMPMVPGFARPATGHTRKESEGKNTPFIGYTCLKNVGIPLNEQTSKMGNDDSICSFKREEEISRLKRQLDNTSRTNRTPILKFENSIDQPVLHSSQWMTKNRLQS